MKTDVIDISHWQQDPIDFVKIKGSGVVGVIHKATEGTSYVDPKYAPRREQAIAAGLLWGAYHFFRPADVKQQAEHFLKTSGDKVLLCLDHEDLKCSLDMAASFCEYVFEKTGQRPVIYSGHVLKEQATKATSELLSYVGQHRLWLAQYGPAPSFPKSHKAYWLWQWTDKGSVPSISPVDCNQAISIERVMKEWLGDGPFPVSMPVPTPPPATQRKANILMFGGLYGDRYSAGLKSLLNQAKSTFPWVDQVYSEYHPYTNVDAVLNTITRWRDPCYIGTHSFGLTALLEAMEKLSKYSQFKIPYLLAIDSSQYWVGTPKVPYNIIECRNYYQRTWVPFAIKGSPLFRPDGASTGITNKQLYVHHTEMDDQKEIHDQFIEDIRRVHS